MKAKVLMSLHYDRSGYRVLRVYLEPDFAQAEIDKELIQSVSDKDIHLVECEVFNGVSPVKKQG